MPENKANTTAEPPVQLRHVFARQTSPFNCVAYSPDGKYVASGSDDKTVRVWEAESGKLLRTLEGHASTVWSVSWSADGKYLASGATDNTVRVWEAETGKLLRTLESHASLVQSVSLSADGKYLASGSNDFTVRVWEAESGKLLRTLEGHAHFVRSVSWSADGKYVASGSTDRTVRVWEAESGKLLRTLEGHADTVWSVSWSANGKYLGSGSSDSTVRVWEAESGKLLRTLKGQASVVRSVSWSADGRYVASGSGDNTVRVWDAGSEKPLRILEGHTSYVTSLAYSRDWKFVVVATSDGMATVRETKTGALIKSVGVHVSKINSLSWWPLGRWIASGSDDNTLKVWEAESGKLLGILEVQASRILSVLWSPEGKYLASGSDDGIVRIWEAETRKLLRTLEGHDSGVLTLSWSVDGRYLASASYDKTVRVWDAESWLLLSVLEGHIDTVCSLSWSPDGKCLVSGSADNSLCIWNVGDETLLRRLEGFTSTVLSVSWSQDGKYLAGGSADQTIRVWDVESGQEVRLYESPNPSYTFLDLAFCTVGSMPSSFGYTKLGDPDIVAGVLEMEASGRDPVTPVTSIVSAKIVLVGESEVGKSCLAHRLATGDYHPGEGSTHGMRLWPMKPEDLHPAMAAPPGQQRELVIWDLGGQSEYRLVHQLFLHDTTLALVLMDPTRGEKAFNDVEEWDQRLCKQLRNQAAVKLLVGTKHDQWREGMIDQRRIDQLKSDCRMAGFFATSAQTSHGLGELLDAIAQELDWDSLSQTTRPLLFQRIREAINQRREQGEVAVLYSDLLAQVQVGNPDHFESGAVNAVVESLQRQGVIVDARLATGQRALVLQIEEVNRYANSLILESRSERRSVPVIELTEITSLESYPGIKPAERLHPFVERIVIECVVQLLLDKGICLKHEGLLIFPASFPSVAKPDDDGATHRVSLYYDFSGAIDHIYSSLVVRLDRSEKFGRVRLWKDQAEFEKTGQGICGLRRKDQPERKGGWSHLDLLFDDRISPETRDQFTYFVDEHLRREGVEVQEIAGMVCECGRAFDEELVREHIEAGEAEILCPRPTCKKPNRISDVAKKDRATDPAVERNLFALKTKNEKLEELIGEKGREEAREVAQAIKPIEIFISYSHRDEELKDELLRHLSGVVSVGRVVAWDDRRIGAGEVWAREIDNRLDSASVILLLVSANFLASQYCSEIEVRRALQRQASGRARVVPVILRQCVWKHALFSELQALPKDAKPVMSWTDRDEAFTNVAEGVSRAVAEVLRPSLAEPAAIAKVKEQLALLDIEPDPIRILHLSDLHFGKDDDPVVKLQPLVADLRDRSGGLGFDRLDYLVISGDLTNTAAPEEFDRAYEFVSGLIKRFELTAARCVIVPGNHDLSWDPTPYGWQQKRKVDQKALNAGSYVPQGDGFLIRDDAAYRKRFDGFRRFHHELFQIPYPQDADKQCLSFLFEETRIQFLALNSAWEIDEYFRERSGINQSALSHGLLDADAQLAIAKKKVDPLRIVVCHHPVTGNEKITRDAFLERLRQVGVRLCLHGHVHEERADLIGYTHPARSIHAAGAGSFGAPVNDRPESTPRLYNLIEIWRDHRKARIHTRALRKEDGAWQGWAVWPGSSSLEKRAFYEVEFKG